MPRVRKAATHLLPFDPLDCIPHQINIRPHPSATLLQENNSTLFGASHNHRWLNWTSLEGLVLSPSNLVISAPVSGGCALPPRKFPS